MLANLVFFAFIVGDVHVDFPGLACLGGMTGALVAKGKIVDGIGLSGIGFDGLLEVNDGFGPVVLLNGVNTEVVEIHSRIAIDPEAAKGKNAFSGVDGVDQGEAEAFEGFLGILGEKFAEIVEVFFVAIHGSPSRGLKIQGRRVQGEMGGCVQ